MGHATAMNNLVCAYDNGDGTPQNYELAGYWYVKAVNSDTEDNETIKKNLQIFADKHPGMTIKMDGGEVVHFPEKISNESCFITTAVCDSFGKPDNCYELTSFRKFRDGWLSRQTDGRALIAEYYEIAPRIVRHINSMGNAKEIYRSIWDNYLQPCLTYIEEESLACFKTANYRLTLF